MKINRGYFSIKEYFLKLLDSVSGNDLGYMRYNSKPYFGEQIVGGFQPLIDIAKDLIDTAKPYKSWWYALRDLLQPLRGLGNIARGILYLVSMPILFLGFTVAYIFTSTSLSHFAKNMLGNLSRSISWLIDGVNNIVKGSIRIVTTPLAWIIRMPLRGIITAIKGKDIPAFEERNSVKNLISKYDSISEDLKDTPEAITLFDELHRKYIRQISKGGKTHIEKTVEAKAYTPIAYDPMGNHGNGSRYFSVESANSYVSLFRTIPTKKSIQSDVTSEHSNAHQFSALDIFKNHLSLTNHPKTKDEIYKNQQLRYDSFVQLTTKSGKVEQKDIAAIKKFWATQTHFYVQFLMAHQDLFKNLDNMEIKDPNITKKFLINSLNTLLLLLENKDKDSNIKISEIIGLLSNDTKKPLPEKLLSDNQNHDKLQQPTLSIQKGNAISFALKQSEDKKVLIMDAANAQRPGVAAYQKGSFQEALTRSTDLYWKILVDFHNVLERLKNDNANVVDVDANSKKIDVLSYQARFLKLILYFVKKSIEDETYFESGDFLKEFFSYGDQIYGEMQNIVFEIPSDYGFTKNCQIVELQNVESTQHLFDENQIFKNNILKQKENRVLIVETAAPDKRAIEGKYDRACTFNKMLQDSNQNNIADNMLRYSITYTLNQAIRNNVDVVLINAFGCGAFKNKPELVAKIFSSVLNIYADKLKGKHIYFMDLNEDMCKRFNAVFNKQLAKSFSIKPYAEQQEFYSSKSNFLN